MKIDPRIKVFGDTSYRNKKCPTERAEQVTAVNWCRAQYPNGYGKLIFHTKLDGKKSHAQVSSERMEGVTKSVPDIIIPGYPMGMFELKRKDHTISRWQPGQQDYLLLSQERGCWVCVCLGYEGFIEAVKEWHKVQ